MRLPFVQYLRRGWQEWIEPDKPQLREVPFRPIDAPVVKVMGPPDPALAGIKCRFCGSSNVVIRYGKYHCNDGGIKHEWEIQPKEPPKGQRAIALEAGPPRYGLDPSEWPAKWRW